MLLSCSHLRGFSKCVGLSTRHRTINRLHVNVAQQSWRIGFPTGSQGSTIPQWRHRKGGFLYVEYVEFALTHPFDII